MTEAAGAALAVLLAVLGLAPGAPGAGFRDGFSGHPRNQPWAEGSVHGVWQTRYHGYGSVQVVCRGGGDGALQLRPAAATRADETHAALVTTRAPVRDGVLAVDARTTRQLRVDGPANPWEVAWVVFRYVDDEHFYYLALKTNGWELGKRDPAYPGGQRFLDSGVYPTFQPGAWAAVRVVMAGAALTVDVDAVRLSETVDGERPILAGAVGMYTEDAEVQFDNVAFLGT